MTQQQQDTAWGRDEQRGFKVMERRCRDFGGSGGWGGRGGEQCVKEAKEWRIKGRRQERREKILKRTVCERDGGKRRKGKKRLRNGKQKRDYRRETD